MKLKYWSSLQVWQKIMLAVILGVLFGLFFKEQAIKVAPLGTLFMTLIKMIIVPLIFASIASAIMNLSEHSSMGRISFQTLAFYLFTSGVAATIGIMAAKFFGLDSLDSLAGLLQKSDISNADIIIERESISFASMIMDFFPSNPIDSMAQGQTIQVIVFAVFMGFSIVLAGKKGKVLGGFINSLEEVMYKMTGIVMSFAPIGVFALMASAVAKQDLNVIFGLMRLMATTYGIYIFFVVVIYGLFLFFIVGLNPWKFLRKMLPVQLFAYSSSSSAATLPMALDNVKTNLGVSSATANFCLPLGATVNMNGTCMTVCIYTLFLAGLFGVQLDIADYIAIGLFSTIISVGTAAIPGASVFLLTSVLVVLGFSDDQIFLGVGLILSIDRLMDMARTAVNVTGDSLVAVIVDKVNKTLDIDTYNK